MLKFYHCNHSVLNMERSIKFYEEHLGLEKYRDIIAYQGALRLVFMKDKQTNFSLELTWNRDHTSPYELGEKEFHVALYADNFEEIYEKHKAAGIIVSENLEIGIYFIEDPDGYIIEIVNEKINVQN